MNMYAAVLFNSSTNINLFYYKIFFLFLAFLSYSSLRTAALLKHSEVLNEHY